MVGGVLDYRLVKAGTTGFIDSMSCCHSDGLRNTYNVCFSDDGDQIETMIYEEEMKDLLTFTFLIE